MTQITHLFTDLGGVLLTNGWDRGLRKRTAAQFGFDADEFEDRHRLTYDTYESGKISLSTYLERALFYEPRPFAEREVVDFILGAARAFPAMIDLVKGVKARYHLKVGVVSNEGRELSIDRANRFHLGDFVDFFIMSSTVHLRKPDEDIFRIALDAGQVEADHVVYLEDRRMFAEVAAGLGIHAIWHRSLERTTADLAALGLSL
jgi:putative hydrolase of the HAD superfamily